MITRRTTSTEFLGLVVLLLVYGVSYMQSAAPSQANANKADYGHTLSYPVVEKGLQELQPGIHFDMGPRLNMEHPFMAERAGVYYDGKHICSIDRGIIPEYKVWTQEDGAVEIPIVDAERYDDAVVAFVEILPTSPIYQDAWDLAAKGHDNYKIDRRADGDKLFHHRCMRVVKVRGRVLRVGWRHTFERLVAAKIPGVTRQSLATKFGVDMNRMPVGSKEEVEAAILAE